MINGIPVKVATQDKQLEVLYLASFRKAPTLADISKRFNKLNAEISMLESKVLMFQRKMKNTDFSLSPEESEQAIDTIAEKIDTLSDKLEDTSAEVIECVKNFYLAALTGAGYDKETANEKLQLIPFESFGTIRESCRLGAMSVLDFFSEKSRAQ